MNKNEITNILIGLSIQYDFKITIEELKNKYNEKHRHYHTWDNHIVPMIESITDDYKNKKFLEIKTYDWEGNLSIKDKELNKEIYEKLLIATLFHDIIYDPKSETNEKDSIVFMIKNITASDEFIEDVSEMILSTINHNSKNIFIKYDLEILTKDFSKLLEWEKQIQSEYSFVNWSHYKTERIKILNKLQSAPIEKININGIDTLIEVIKTTVPKVGIYAGSFNPFHIGHMDILNKANNIFDKIIIVKGLNIKKHFDTYEYTREYQKLKELLPEYEVVSHKGLLTDFIKEQKDVDITLIRGLRNGTDLEVENVQSAFMKDMYPELKVVYIRSEKELEHISSSAIRELRAYNEELVKKYLP